MAVKIKHIIKNVIKYNEKILIKIKPLGLPFILRQRVKIYNVFFNGFRGVAENETNPC